MPHKKELDYMNALACLLVILIHVLSIGISSLNSKSWQAAVIYFPWRLSAFVVPMFLYTGAAKMILQYQNKKITLPLYAKYLLSRLKKIYFPYMIWVGIYYFCFLQIGYVRGNVNEFISYLLIGNLSSPFYYIVIVMQFYLLMPIWLWVVRNLSIYIAIGTSVIITLCAQRVPYLFSLRGIEFPYMDRVFCTYILYWIIGLYIGSNYDKIYPIFSRRFDIVFCGIIIIFCCGLGYMQYLTKTALFDLNNIKMISDLCSIMLLHSLMKHVSEEKFYIGNILQKIYNSSFFVYLSHCLFLTVTTVFLEKIGIHKISLLLLFRFAVCYTIPFLTYYCWKKITFIFKIYCDKKHKQIRLKETTGIESKKTS